MSSPLNFMSVKYIQKGGKHEEAIDNFMCSIDGLLFCYAHMERK